MKAEIDCDNLVDPSYIEESLKGGEGGGAVYVHPPRISELV